MSKIIIYTRAYNAKETLRRTVKSVLSQTYPAFVYYLLDNASTDSTYEIIKEYAKQDSRIVPLHNEQNNVGNWIIDVIKNHGNDCYVCMLDADDEYYPDFLKKMLTFMKKNELDIGACGNDFIDVDSGQLYGVRKLDQNLFLHGREYEEHFPLYYQYMRTVWGKIYSVAVLNRCNFDNTPDISYGGDTWFTMEAFRNSTRAGILAESLHKYYISPKSVSYQFDKRRVDSDRILFDRACNFLVSKYGTVSDANISFLRMVYYNAIKDTLNVLLNSQISVSDKLVNLLDVFQSQHTQDFIMWPGAITQKQQLFSQTALWILSQNEVRSGAELDITAEILAAMHIFPNEIEGWDDALLFLLFSKTRDKQVERGYLSDIDSNIVSVAAKSPFLIDLNAEFLCYFKSMIFAILQKKNENALKQIEDLITQEKDIPDEYIEDLLKLALNLSAMLEKQDCFIYFKKLQILTLIELSADDKAAVELADWDEILPDDTDFKKIRERLGK